MTGNYREEGWQIERGLIPAEVIAAVRARLEGALDTTLDQMRELGVRVGTPDMVGDIHALLNGPDAESIDRDLRVIMTGHFPFDVRMDPAIREIPRQPAVQEFLTGLFGEPELRMHMPPIARYVLPGNADAGVPAHQDVSYNSHMSDFMTVWIPLVEITETCGGVTVFPGSDTKRHEPGMMAHGIWFDEIDMTGYQPVDCVPMQPGDVLVFNPLLTHRSMANTSDRIRFSLDCRFFPGSASSTKHYLDVNNWEIVAPHG